MYWWAITQAAELVGDNTGGGRILVGDNTGGGRVLVGDNTGGGRVLVGDNTGGGTVTTWLVKFRYVRLRCLVA